MLRPLSTQGFVNEAVHRAPLDSHLVLLCDVGVVSRVAAGRLLDAGFRRVDVVRGGLEAWGSEEVCHTAANA